MTIRNPGPILAVLLAVALATLATAPTLAAEEGTVNALATWQGQGRFFRTGEQQAFFGGVFTGVLFVENNQGALHAAHILCPGSLDIDLGTGKQAGQGRCVITARSGDRVFARWECTGVHLEGCSGRFTLTGGTGRFQGITGESDFMVKSAMAELSLTASGNEIREEGAGLAIWPSLQYRIP